MATAMRALHRLTSTAHRAPPRHATPRHATRTELRFSRPAPCSFVSEPLPEPPCRGLLAGWTRTRTRGQGACAYSGRACTASSLIAYRYRVRRGLLSAQFAVAIRHATRWEIPTHERTTEVLGGDGTRSLREKNKNKNKKTYATGRRDYG